MEEERLNEGIAFVASYTKNISDWSTLKKELLKFFTPQERKCFSTRDPLTKRQRMNDFEILIAKKWHELTGSDVIIRDCNAKARKIVT